MIDYEYKAKVLESGLPKLYNKISYALFVGGSKEYDLQSAIQIDNFMSELNGSDWYECQKINNANFHRVRRLKWRIQSMLESGMCNFVTLTFKDDVLANTSRDTRKQYVRKYLKQLNVPYVANIDFGGKKGREHYHALIQSDCLNYDLWHKYGAIKGERVIVIDNSNVRLAKYISKLTNHAIKETTGCQRIIYSRG